jgi:hypothetical protein
MHPRRTGAGVKAQEHRALGDEASASAKVNLGGDSAEERFEVRFGDVVALSGDYFYPTAEPALDPQAAALGPEVLASGGLFALAAVPGHEGTAVGTRDEVICALRVMAADQGLVDPRFGSGGEFAHFRFSATASETEVEQRVRDRFLALGASNDDHFVDPGPGARPPRATAPSPASARRVPPTAASTAWRWTRPAAWAASGASCRRPWRTRRRPSTT